jgi:hypothetical protein
VYWQVAIATAANSCDSKTAALIFRLRGQFAAAIMGQLHSSTAMDSNFYFYFHIHLFFVMFDFYSAFLYIQPIYKI